VAAEAPVEVLELLLFLVRLHHRVVVVVLQVVLAPLEDLVPAEVREALVEVLVQPAKVQRGAQLLVMILQVVAAALVKTVDSEQAALAYRLQLQEHQFKGQAAAAAVPTYNPVAHQAVQAVAEMLLQHLQLQQLEL
jgi:hypothetical protein